MARNDDSVGEFSSALEDVDKAKRAGTGEAVALLVGAIVKALAGLSYSIERVASAIEAPDDGLSQ